MRIAATKSHLTLLASVTQSLVKENQDLRQKQQTAEATIHQMKLEIMKLSGFPIDVRVNMFKERVASPPFYSHQNGYQLVLVVYPNRFQSYVSIYTYVVQGPYEHLKGPFQGEITIQIVNQAGDHDHVERTISYANITPDVHAGIPSCRSRWCGFRTFLAHSALHYDAAKKTQYLKDNHLIVRMVKVSLPAA